MYLFDLKAGPDFTVFDLALRFYSSLIVTPGPHHHEALARGFAHNAMAYGFDVGESLVEALGTLHVAELSARWRGLEPYLRQQWAQEQRPGGRVKRSAQLPAPPFPDFPTGVPDTTPPAVGSDRVSHVGRLLHRSEREVVDLFIRDEFFPRRDLDFDIDTWSPSAHPTVTRFVVQNYPSAVLAAVPRTFFRHRWFNGVWSLVYRHLPASRLHEVDDLVEHPLDILRLIHQGYRFVYPPHYRPPRQALHVHRDSRQRALSRARRRHILSLLERFADAAEHLERYRGRWAWWVVRLHAGDYRERFPTAFRLLHQLRNRSPGRHPPARIEAAIEHRDADGALAELSLRPEDFTRRIRQVLRRGFDVDDVMAAFRTAAPNVSVAQLLKCHHQLATDASPGPRFFFPKGDLGRGFEAQPGPPPLPADVCARATAHLEELLMERFASRRGLGRVFVDPRLASYCVPLRREPFVRPAGVHSGAGLRLLGPGSRIPLPPHDVLRFAVLCPEATVDVSHVVYGPTWELLGPPPAIRRLHSYGRRSVDADYPKAVQAGPLDLEALRGSGAAYVVIYLFRLRGKPFALASRASLAWEHAAPAGEHGGQPDPSRSCDLTTAERITVAAVVDLERCELVWGDLGLRRRPPMTGTDSTPSRGLPLLGRYLTLGAGPNLYDLMRLHGRARGELVDDPARAQTVFSVDEGMPSFDDEALRREYL